MELIQTFRALLPIKSIRYINKNLRVQEFQPDKEVKLSNVY